MSKESNEQKKKKGSAEKVVPPAPAPPQEKYRSKPDLKKEGFPETVSDAFLHTADRLQCVVMSRVPGKATTTLISEGYDLKGYFIKAKSCNWGPMSGFLCELPPLNKKGAQRGKGKKKLFGEAMIYNHECNLEYRDEKFAGMRDRDREEIEKRKKEAQKKEADPKPQAKKGPAKQATDPAPSEVASVPFIPIILSDKRKEEIVTGDKTVQKLGDGKSASGPDEGKDVVYGIAFDQAEESKRTVVMEFFLVAQGQEAKPLWKLYYGGIYVKPEERFLSYFEWTGKDGEKPYKGSVFKPGGDEPSIPIDFARTILDPAIKKIIGEGAEKLPSTAYPVNGICNPFSHYTKEADRYKNAVTGDYDLFAIWPMVPKESPVTFDDLKRIAEFRETGWFGSQTSNRKAAEEKPGGSRPLFVSVAGRPFTVQGNANTSKNIFIEFIPGYGRIGKLEQWDQGNINDAVQLVAGTLNSLASYFYKGGKGLPNRAFHNDEGGRPGIDEVDLPVAVFLPPTLRERLSPARLGKKKIKKERILLIETHLEFLDLICLLKHECYIPLNSAWLFDLLQPDRDSSIYTKAKDLFTNGLGIEDGCKDGFDKAKAILTLPQDMEATAADEESEGFVTKLIAIRVRTYKGVVTGEGTQ